MLIAADDPEQRELACRWAQEWVDRTAPPNRPQALLRARRLLGGEFAAGRVDEAKVTLATVAALSWGCRVPSSTAVRAVGPPNGRTVPADFLDQAVNVQVVQRV